MAIQIKNMQSLLLPAANVQNSEIVRYEIVEWLEHDFEAEMIQCKNIV